MARETPRDAAVATITLTDASLSPPWTQRFGPYTAATTPSTTVWDDVCRVHPRSHILGWRLRRVVVESFPLVPDVNTTLYDAGVIVDCSGSVETSTPIDFDAEVSRLDLTPDVERPSRVRLDDQTLALRQHESRAALRDELSVIKLLQMKGGGRESTRIARCSGYVDDLESDSCWVLTEALPSLAELQSSSATPWPVVLCWARQLVEALVQVHAVGVCHLGVHPRNVLLDRSTGQVKLSNFSTATPFHTKTPPRRGAVAFAAPEQLDPCFGVIEARTDVFGLGATLYYLLTGRTVWELHASPPQIVKDLLTDGHDVLSGERLFGIKDPQQLKAPHWVELLIMQCLSRHATQRPSLSDIAKVLS